MKQLVKALFRLVGLDLVRYDQGYKEREALHAKYKEFTMVSLPSFTLNLELCNSFRHLSGDYVECGVWRGGMSAAIAELLGPERMVHLFDSFEGLPLAKEIDGKEALAWQRNTTSPGYFDNCSAEEAYVMNAMSLAGHSHYRTYKGWFDQTLPTFGDHSIAILRLDGDWYDSIMTCLEHLFPKVVQGGIVLLDDYYTWDGCAKAVHDYLSKNRAPSRVHQWKNGVAYLVKKG